MWRSRRPALRVVGGLIAMQAGIGAIAAALWLALSGPLPAAAAAAGALIAIVPTAYYAAQVFSKPPGTAPRRVLRAFYIGEAVKLILTAALFMIALQWLSGHFLPLLTTFAAALSTYWIFFLGALRT